MSRSRSNWTLHSFVFTVIFLSFMIIGSSSWLIITQSSTQSKADIAPDTSQYFESELTFDGNAHYPTPNAAGLAIFGVDGAYEQNNNGETGYTATWVASTVRCYSRYVNGQVVSGYDVDISELVTNGNFVESDLEALKGVIAGTHYYEIKDNATGQIISKRHAVQIKPVEFDVTVGSGNIFIANESPSVSVTMTPKDGIDKKITFNHKFTRDDYTPSTTIPVAYAKTHNVLGNSSNTCATTPINTITTVNATGYNNNNYLLPETYDVSVTLLPAVLDSSTGKYYADLVQAFNATASSSAVVVALQTLAYNSANYTSGTHFNHIIAANCTLGSNVKLIIPYDASNDAKTGIIDGVSYPFPVQTTTSGSASALGVASKRKNVVTVKSGKTFYSNGTIYIAGQVTGGQNGLYGSSLTNGNHAEIALEQNAKIEAYNDIYCYGFISGYNNGSSIKMNKGNVISPFTVVEHRGGTAFVSMIGGIFSAANPNLQTAAFNRFYLCSITSNLIVTSNATVTGYADLYANDAHNTTMVKLIGTSSAYLLQLVSGSTVECTFNPSAIKNDAGTYTYGRNEIDIYGNATINYLSIAVKTSIASATLSTEKVHFPISHYWKISLHRAKGSNKDVTVSSHNQKIKLLPEAELHIGEGVTFDVTNLVVFNSAQMSVTKDDGTAHTGTLVESGSGNRAIDVTGDAVLNVSGTLKVASFGGYANTLGSDAKINITSSNSVTIKELQTLGDTWGGCEYYNVTIAAAGTVVTKGDNDLIGTPNTALSKMEYASISYDPNVYGWINPNTEFNLFYEHKYLNSGDGSVSALGSEHVITNSNPGTYIIAGTIAFTAPTTTSTNIVFAGWYTTPECSADSQVSNTEGDILLANATSGGDATIYGLWVDHPDPGNVSVSFDTSNNAGSVSVSINPMYMASGITFNPYTNEQINNAVSVFTNDTSVAKYFGGWYTDSSFTTKVSETDGIVLTSSTTLYAQWLDKVSVSFDVSAAVDWTEIKNDEAFTTTFYYVPGTMFSPYSHSTLPYSRDADFDYQYVFDKWQAITSTSNDTVGTGGIQLRENTVFKASWATKHTLTFHLRGTTVVTKYVADGTIFNPWTLSDATAGDADITISYYFDGWFSDSGLTNAVANEAVAITGNMEYYSKWGNKFVISLSWSTWRPILSSRQGVTSVLVNGIDRTSEKNFYVCDKQQITIVVTGDSYLGSKYNITGIADKRGTSYSITAANSVTFTYVATATDDTITISGKKA